MRLRLLSASTARIYDVGFADGRRLDLIATDGGLLESPEPMTRIQPSVGERAEILVALEAGERAVLRSFEPDLGTDPFEGRFQRRRGHVRPARDPRRRAAPRCRRTPADPVRELETPDPDQSRRIRRFELGNRDINGLEMDMRRIDEVVRVGDTEIWEVENTTGTPHSFHVHDVRFRVSPVRRRATTATAFRAQGHRLPATPRDGAIRDELRGLQRPRHPVHVPLPGSRARGPRHDGAVRRHRWVSVARARIAYRSDVAVTGRPAGGPRFRALRFAATHQLRLARRFVTWCERVCSSWMRLTVTLSGGCTARPSAPSDRPRASSSSRGSWIPAGS